ncbi:MAG: hypothetical protein P0Y53_20825 [Candidatus Pseudobacter hemicellulosilyticus]|uniref:DKNYY family protein n=1 Tax=Candidatus Pseudobacter hemicellulosilyticus TaxID=3121375 RepID=A0AAJ6BEU3_9BACT|nr:MAG: hypothetical protein P0Y53_20825 [Pseudobacter sp.]
MKKKFLLPGIACLLLLIVSCRKFCDIPGLIPGRNDKDFILKEMDYQGTTYRFYFNQQKQRLDSIGTLTGSVRGVFRLLRTGNRLDSVYYTSDALTWVNKDITYDNAGNMTLFRHHPIRPGFATSPTILTHADGHLKSITYIDPLLSYWDDFDTLYYNGNNDVYRWVTRVPRSNWTDVRLFSFDNRHNPLYYVDDLIIVFSEMPQLRECFLSQHNSTAMDFPAREVHLDYQNTYDKKNRLVKKVFTQWGYSKPDTLVFRYLK